MPPHGAPRAGALLLLRRPADPSASDRPRGGLLVISREAWPAGAAREGAGSSAPQRARGQASERTRGEGSATASDTYCVLALQRLDRHGRLSLDRWTDRRPPRPRARNRQGTRATALPRTRIPIPSPVGVNSAGIWPPLGAVWPSPPGWPRSVLPASTHLSFPDWPPDHGPMQCCAAARNFAPGVQTHVAATVLALAVAAAPCRTPELRVRLRYVRRRRHLAA